MAISNTVVIPQQIDLSKVVDNETIEYVDNKLQVKDNGITVTKLSNDIKVGDKNVIYFDTNEYSVSGGGSRTTTSSCSQSDNHTTVATIDISKFKQPFNLRISAEIKYNNGNGYSDGSVWFSALVDGVCKGYSPATRSGSYVPKQITISNITGNTLEIRLFDSRAYTSGNLRNLFVMIY